MTQRTPSSLINHGFKITNGEIVIQIGREHQFKRFVEILDKEEWLEDPRFSTREGWVENIETLRNAVREWAGDQSPIEVCGSLASAGIAAAPSFEAEDLINDPHVVSRNMLVEVPTQDSTPALAAGNPIKMAGVEDEAVTPPPSLGEHTNQILSTELDMTESQIVALREKGIIK